MSDPPPHADPQKPGVEMLLWAYRHGVFPMAEPESSVASDLSCEAHTAYSEQRLHWYTADPRTILPLEGFHVPRSLARVVRANTFEIRSDTAFDDVIRACARDRSDDNRTWINEEIIRAYTRLHRAGHAHSVEAWVGQAEGITASRHQGIEASSGAGGEGACVQRIAYSVERRLLVGGLYGVHIGGAFFGESMFTRPDLGGSNASKACLVHLMNRLREAAFTLVDTQFLNPHLVQFGAIEIPQREYLRRLKEAVNMECEWPFSDSEPRA